MGDKRGEKEGEREREERGTEGDRREAAGSGYPVTLSPSLAGLAAKN